MANLDDVVLKLPLAERARLTRKLLASLDEANDVDAEEAWLAEVVERVREVDEGTVLGEDWPTVRDRIAARLRSR